MDLETILKDAKRNVATIEALIAQQRAKEAYRPGAIFQVDAGGNLRLTEASAGDDLKAREAALAETADVFTDLCGGNKEAGKAAARRRV